MGDSRNLRLRFLSNVPVYPEQISLGELSRKLRISNVSVRNILSRLPSEMPIAESDGFFCFPTLSLKKKTIQRERNGTRWGMDNRR